MGEGADHRVIGPDGTVFPNHHKISVHDPEARIEYSLHWGENGPKHADAVVTFEPDGDSTRLTLRMIFVTKEEYEAARSFGAVELGHETLAKLAAFVDG